MEDRKGVIILEKGNVYSLLLNKKDKTLEK